MRAMKRLLLLLLFIAASVSARNITEKDLFKFNWIGDPQLSPDGSQVTFVRVTVDEKKDAYNTAIWSVATRAGAEPRRITNGPRDASPRWSRDGKLLAFTRSIDKDGKPQPSQIWILRFDGGEPHVLTSMAKSVESIAWSPSSNAIAFTATTKPEDLEKKDEKKKDDEHESDVRVINQAVYRANGAGYRDASRDTHIWTIDVTDDETAKPKQLTNGDFDERDISWSPDGSRIYFTSNRVAESYYDRRDTDLYAIPAGGGAMTKIADIEGPISAYAISPDGKWVAFGGEINNPVHSYDQPDLWLASTTPGSAAKNLTASYDYDVLSGVGGDQRAPRAAGGGGRPVWSDDGKSIIVVAAEEGHVVLYPNPRGSTSYGQEFGNIIQYHYPGDDFKDLMAGVDAVVAKGYIDPKKLCVTGGSGGGLLTDWVVTQTDRFAAAAAQRDIADWATFWYTADFSLFQPTWFRKAPWEDPKDYAARSPITYIERVKTPLMLILAEAD